MTVFDVYLNNHKVCRAGVGRDGVLTAIVNWVKLTGPAAATARRLKQPGEELRLHVGGLRNDTHMSWSDRSLEFGDRIEVVLAKAVEADAPATEKRRDRTREEALRSDYEKNATRFLNVDLDIKSKSPLDSLVKAFGRRVVMLHVGKEGREYGAHLELATESNSPDVLLRRFVALINHLPRSAKQHWNRARAREFNIGIQAGAKPHSTELRLQPATLRAVAGVRARIGLTVYGAGPHR